MQQSFKPGLRSSNSGFENLILSAAAHDTEGEKSQATQSAYTGYCCPTSRDRGDLPLLQWRWMRTINLQLFFFSSIKTKGNL